MKNGSEVSDVEVIFHRAESEERLGNKGEAERLYTEVINHCQQNDTSQHMTPDRCKLLALAYNNRGHLRYLKVDFTEAVEDYTSALSHDQALTVAFYNRGLIHYRLGRFAEAISDQQSAIHQDPEFSSAKHCLDQCIQAQTEQQQNLQT